MNADMIEHRAIVQRIEGDRVIVAMETAGCGSCAQGSQCGIGQLSAGRSATLLTLPLTQSLQVGDTVTVGLPGGGLKFSALLGYLFPALAMLLGAGIGAFGIGSDAATAFGALCGFAGALILARIVIGLFPAWMPSPQLISSQLSPQEHLHDYR